jgi:ABC-2 type transport system ATP-binding protein
MAMSDTAISTSSLTRRFGRVLAVDEVSLRIPEGSVYGYLGRNGAGKTTTIQMLMGLLLPTSGTISVMSFDPFRQDVPMKRIVSYVPERVHMPDWMTVQGLMAFGRAYTRTGTRRWRRSCGSGSTCPPTASWASSRAGCRARRRC